MIQNRLRTSAGVRAERSLSGNFAVRLRRRNRRWGSEKAAVNKYVFYRNQNERLTEVDLHAGGQLKMFEYEMEVTEGDHQKGARKADRPFMEWIIWNILYRYRVGP